MGQSFHDSLDNMKFFTVLALAAVAFAEPEAEGNAEANPALLYGSYGYPYAGVAGGYPATYGYGYRTYGAYPYSYSYYGKRSADAEPEADAEADPALLYGAYGYPYAGVYGGYRAYGAYPATYYGAHPYVYGVPFGFSTGQDPITQGLDPVTQGVVTKRSADAEADAAVLYGGYGYPYATYAHSYVPFGSSSGLDPITQGLDASTQGYVPYGYAGYAWGK